MLRRLTTMLMLAPLSGCYFWGGYYSFRSPNGKPHLQLAQQRAEAGQYEEAISDYEAHIKARLASPERPSGENPYFYKALIGDLYLKLGKPSDAKRSYLEAQANQVDNEIVVDRLRRLARWYREKGDYDEALALLKEYRKLNPLMFDFDIDQLHKEAIRREDEGKTGAQNDGVSGTSTPAE